MTLPSEIARESQKLATDRLVKLYEIDATDLGGTVFRFCSTVDQNISVLSITSVGALATLFSLTPHTAEDGDIIQVAGAEQPEYNGLFSVTVIDATTLQYTMTGDPGEDATGSNLLALRLNNSMKFGGHEYTAVEIEVSGFEWSGQGSQATPKLTISNKNKLLVGAAIALNNLRGAKFTRIRTFRKHLDDGSDPDSSMIYPKEILRVNRKTAQNKVFMEFELANPLDQEGAVIPRAQCLKSTCWNSYRRWDSSAGVFDYSNATCPYAGNLYFTRDNKKTTDPAKDECSRQLRGCKDRFGSAPLPTRAVPGIGGR